MWQRLKALPWNKIIVVTLIAVAVIVGLIWGKKLLWPTKPPDTTPQVAPEAPQAVKVEKIYIPGPTKILVYNREDILQQIPVAPTVAQNPNNQFTATAAVVPSPYGGTAVAFINRSTGVSAISYAPKPRPLFGFGGDGGMGIRAGMGVRDSTGYTGTVYARQKLIRVSDVQVSAVGELTANTYGKPEGRALVEAELFSWR